VEIASRGCPFASADGLCPSCSLDPAFPPAFKAGGSQDSRMSESSDIRDRSHLTPDDILELSFIRRDLPYVFRRHYREGLRSHIFEVHDQISIERERHGLEQDGILVFPRSRPRYMLRLFRHHFRDMREALEEIKRFQVLLNFLSPSYIATSNEFLVDYPRGDRSDILLCGLQEYVRGEIFDPWSYESHPESLSDQIEHMLEVHAAEGPFWAYREALFRHIRSFVYGIKRLIVEAGYVPDLSGVGNLILTPDCRLRLVDINNISPVSYQDHVFLDDKGYPICDKSVEVLAILEKKLLRADMPPQDALYDIFLHPERMARVRELEREFRRSLREGNAADAFPAG